MFPEEHLMEVGFAGGVISVLCATFGTDIRIHLNRQGAKNAKLKHRDYFKGSGRLIQELRLSLLQSCGVFAVIGAARYNLRLNIFLPN